MKPLINWIKGNLLTVAAIALAVIAVVGLVVVHLGGGAMQADATAAGKDMQTAQGLMTTSVKLPPPKPDGDPQLANIPVNQVAIDALVATYAKMDEEHINIYKYAVTFNQAGHTPMVNGLFPDLESTQAAFDARAEYKAAFAKMFEEYSAGALYPQLDAEPPASADEVKAVADRAREIYKTETLLPGQDENSLDDVQRAEIARRRLNAKLTFLTDRARRIHVYADRTLPAPSASGTTSGNYPFQVMGWAFATNQPSPEELWEGQLSLWIQQDIARAIAITNRTEYPESNVMNAPIKRLIKIQVLPDYVGITGKGGIDSDPPFGAGANQAGGAYTPVGTAAANPGGMGGMGMGGMGMGGMGMGPTGMGGMAPPGTPGAPGSTAAPAAPGVTGAKLPDDFGASSTGRRSNEVYDVRHVWVSLVVDAKTLPQIFDNLAKVNFMTVLKMSITDVDEYDALKEGYIYGTEDCVRADLLIETIWLRDWTARLMPTSVRNALGVATPMGRSVASSTIAP